MKSKNLHIMLMVHTLGETYEAPIVEIAAKVFDPETGELGDDHNVSMLNVKKALLMGKASPGALENYMMAHKYDLMIFHNPGYFETLATAVKKLRDFIEAEREHAGVKWENLKIYNLYPAYQLPRITIVDQAINMEDQAIWPSYGVVCAKTIQDIARPLLVEHKIDLPVRPPTRNGLVDECDFQAVVTMHSLRMLNGDHPTQSGKKSKAVKPTVPAEDDEEL
ncbi:putative exoribonuclease Rnase [Achromobacter phage AXY1]|nr:putative exoribonuclease Rnase [Achromobacter phage AXY1]